MTRRPPDSDAGPSGPRGVARWWAYQRERFPIAQHAPVVAAFSYSAVCYSRLLRTGEEDAFRMPGAAIGLVAFGCCLGFFLQLRIADEHKDLEEDARFRPYRPVPRGLVALGELTVLGVVVGVLQAAAALALEPALIILLAIAWIYFGLMTKEFFVRDRLARRPLLYMLSHMAIMPLIDLFATGCDWMTAGTRPPLAGLVLFLGASYFNGVVIEIGRKIRSPMDEEDGVRTYSVVWGRRRAVGAWLAAMALAGGFATLAAGWIGFLLPVGCFVLLGVGVSGWAGAAFLRSLAPGAGGRIELLSGIWVILLYLMLGVVPASILALS